MTKPNVLIDKTQLFLRLQDELCDGLLNESGNINDELSKAQDYLNTYFENIDPILRTLQIGGLRFEYLFLRRHRDEAWISDFIKAMLTEFRSARAKDSAACFITWSKWIESAEQAMRNAISAAYIETEKENLEPELFIKSCFRDIGDILEGSLQPLTKLRLDMRGIAGYRTKKAPPVESMSFGQVIAELYQLKDTGELYLPLSYGLTVSQWRNIAFHNSYILEKSGVICTYGPSGNLRSIIVKISDLLDLARYINDLSYTHKIAYEFFSLENISTLIDYLPTSNLRITEHTKDGVLATGLIFSGFRIEEVGKQSNVLHLRLVDSFSRTEKAVKTALQEAVISYVLLAGPVEVRALAQSGSDFYQFSFQTTLSNGLPIIPHDFSGNIMRLDNHFRPKKL